MDYIFKRGRHLLCIRAKDYVHALALARHDVALHEALPVGFYSLTENCAYVFASADQGVALSRIRRACNLLKSHLFYRVELVEITDI